MGIAALHPSYKSGTRYGYLSSLSTAVKTRMNRQTQNARLMSSSMVFLHSIPTSRDVRFAFHVQRGSR